MNSALPIPAFLAPFLPPAVEWRRAWPLWAFMLLIVLLATGGEPVRELLRYERLPVLTGGQWWRLISGHLVHLGWGHAWLNLAALFVGWLLCGDCFSMPRWALLVTLCALGISAGFLLFEPQLVWYVGLSGVLHGLLAAGALAMLRRREPVAWAFAAFLVIKLLWEQWAGPLPFTAESSGGPVVTVAHLYGAVSGPLAGAALLWLAPPTGPSAPTGSVKTSV